jgi:hypothetical protein
VLHKGEHAAGHEPSGADGRAAPRQLADLDHAAPRADIDPAPGAGGGDLVGLGLTAGVDHDLDTVTSHVIYNA